MTDLYVTDWPRIIDANTRHWDELERRRLVYLVALVALNAADLVLTRIALGMGAGSEQNALMALVILSPLGVVVKLGYPTWLGIRNLRRPIDRGLVRGLGVVTSVYIAVILWDSYAIYRGVR